MINAVQIYLQGILNNLATPYFDTTIAYIGEPIPDTIDDHPRLYVWDSIGDMNRQTMPRGRGFMKVIHSCELYVLALTTPDDANKDQSFPCLIDAIVWKLLTTTMPIEITDPTTSVASQIISIGEKQKWQYALPATDGDQVWLRCSALFTLTIEELIQG